METMTKERMEAYRSNKTAFERDRKIMKSEKEIIQVQDLTQSFTENLKQKGVIKEAERKNNCNGCFGAANGDCEECCRHGGRGKNSGSSSGNG